jgi:catechol 2,3-dioxygenase-like lactoylglutathione lyase family enzyme
MVNVHYMVDDVDASIDFYGRHFGFELGGGSGSVFPGGAPGRAPEALGGLKPLTRVVRIQVGKSEGFT